MPGNVLSGIVKITAPGVDQTFSKIAASTGKAEAGLKRLATTSNGSTIALTNLGRVVQDAPFGFLGIANNLNPLLESFQRLKVQTGSAGGAFKAMAKDLTGAGGLGFALSIVSTLLIVFGDKLFGASKASKEAKEANQKLGEELSNSAVKLTALVGVVQNVNTKYEEKQKALKALNQEYATYLKDLGIEEISLQNISAAYEKIIDSMIRQAVVKGLQNEIAKAVEETATKIITLERAEEKRRLATEAANNTDKKQITSQQQVTKELERFNKVSTDGVLAQQKINESQTAGIAKINNYESALSRLKDQLYESLKPLLSLVTNFEDLGIKLDKPIKTGEIKIEPSKISIEKVSDFDFDALRVSKFLKGKFKIPFTPILETADPGGGTQVGDLSAAEKALIKAGEDLSAAFTGALQSGIGDSLAAFGEGLGNILSGKDFGTQIFQVLGGLLEQIGKALIKFGIIQTGIKKILENPLLPGGIAIGLGITAIALGQLMKNISGARALGGPVQAGGTYLVGERGPELFRPNTGGEIVPNSALGGRGVSSGGMMVTVGGQFALRGQDLIAAITLANQSKSRLQ